MANDLEAQLRKALGDSGCMLVHNSWLVPCLAHALKVMVSIEPDWDMFHTYHPSGQRRIDAFLAAFTAERNGETQ
jgi:hypothetical protein